MPTREKVWQSVTKRVWRLLEISELGPRCPPTSLTIRRFACESVSHHRSHPLPTRPLQRDAQRHNMCVRHMQCARAPHQSHWTEYTIGSRETTSRGVLIGRVEHWCRAPTSGSAALTTGDMVMRECGQAGRPRCLYPRPETSF